MSEKNEIDDPAPEQGVVPDIQGADIYGETPVSKEYLVGRIALVSDLGGEEPKVVQPRRRGLPIM